MISNKRTVLLYFVPDAFPWLTIVFKIEGCGGNGNTVATSIDWKNSQRELSTWHCHDFNWERATGSRVLSVNKGSAIFGKLGAALVDAQMILLGIWSVWNGVWHMHVKPHTLAAKEQTQGPRSSLAWSRSPVHCWNVIPTWHRRILRILSSSLLASIPPRNKKAIWERIHLCFSFFSSSTAFFFFTQCSGSNWHK